MFGRAQQDCAAPVESGRIDPSLDTLRRLVQALKVTLASLLEARSAVDNWVVRRDQRKVFLIARNQLSPDLVGKRVEFLRVELDPAQGGQAATVPT